MNTSSAVRRLAAVMFADMVGYSALMQKDERAAGIARNRMRTVLEVQVPDGRGEIVQFYGDGALCVFQSAIEAVRCAVRVQQAFQEDPPVPVRIGLHTGDIIQDHEGAFGDGVNVAARIESLAVPGAVLISEKVHDEVKNQGDISTVCLGSFQLKNISQLTSVYAVTSGGLRVPQPSDMPDGREQDRQSVAVLPFVNMSADADNEYFSDGITEELINLLARLNDLQVTARTSSFAFKGKTQDVRDIGTALGVRNVLEGSVRKSGTRVRITAQLIDTTSGYHLFSDTYDRTIEDVFEAQDEIAATIVHALRGQLAEDPGGSPRVGPIEPRRPMHPEAHEAYLRGLFQMNLDTPEGARQALATFQNAAQLDLEAALPHSAMAMCHAYLANIGWVLPDRAYPKAREAAHRALELDPNLGEAHVTLGLVDLFHLRDPKAAYPHFQKALSLAPGSSMVRHQYAVYLFTMGEYEEATIQMQSAFELDPFSIRMRLELAWGLYATGHSDQSLALLDDALAANPTLRSVLEDKGWLLALLDRFEEALPVFEKRFALTPGDGRRGITGLGFVYAKLGRTDDALDVLSKLESRARDEPDSVLSMDLATVNLALGRDEEAFQHVLAGVERRVGHAFLLLKTPLGSRFHSHPRWAEMEALVAWKSTTTEAQSPPAAEA